MVKALDNFPIYKRLTKGKDYGIGEEIQRVAEQLTYNEFAGESILNMTWNGKVYKEKCITVVDGIDWRTGKPS